MNDMPRWIKENHDGLWTHWYGDPRIHCKWVTVEICMKGPQWPKYEIEASAVNLTITQHVGDLKRAKKKAEQLYKLIPEILS